MKLLPLIYQESEVSQIEKQIESVIHIITYLGIWSLHCGSPDDSYDNTIILSFVGQTTLVMSIVFIIHLTIKSFHFVSIVH